VRILIPILYSAALFAHDLYLMPQKFRANVGETILLSAHTGDSFLNSEHGVDPARLTSAPAMPEGSWRILGKATHATVKLERAGSQYFAIWTKPKALSMEAAKFEEYLKEEGLLAALELRARKNEQAKMSREMYAKYAKTFVVAGEPTGNFREALGLKIEFVPLADPAALKAGDSLPLQVLYDGKPLADVQVEMALSVNAKLKSKHAIVGRTDAEGKIVVAIPEAGRIRLHCVQMERVAGPAHEWESFWASLTFEVAPTQNTSNR